jgi:hypothetical protein
MMEAVRPSETSVSCGTNGTISQKAVVLILAAVRTWGVNQNNNCVALEHLWHYRDPVLSVATVTCTSEVRNADRAVLVAPRLLWDAGACCQVAHEGSQQQTVGYFLFFFLAFRNRDGQILSVLRCIDVLIMYILILSVPISNAWDS